MNDARTPHDEATRDRAARYGEGASGVPPQAARACARAQRREPGRPEVEVEDQVEVEVHDHDHDHDRDVRAP